MYSLRLIPRDTKPALTTHAGASFRVAFRDPSRPAEPIGSAQPGSTTQIPRPQRAEAARLCPHVDISH